MIVKMQKKFWETGLDLTEKSLNRMIKDDSLLHFSSMGINSSLWVNKNIGKIVEVVLKQMDLPRKETIKNIHKSHYELEKELHICQDRVHDLEREISELREMVALKEVAKPRTRKKAAPKKKSPKTTEAAIS